MIRIADLSPHERFALRAICGCSAVHIDGAWRARGAPAPKLNAFACATLLGAGLLFLQTPQVLMLTARGRELAERLAEQSLPPWLASA